MTHLFDWYGPSTAYAVCFTVTALCLLTGFPRLQENKTANQTLEQTIRDQQDGGARGVCVCVCALSWVRALLKVGVVGGRGVRGG